MANLRKLQKRQKGVALVETIIVTPLLLFLILATAEITAAFVDHNTLTKSARNAARYVSARALVGSTGTVDLNAALLTEVRNVVVFGNPAGTGTSILPGLNPGDIQVQNLGNDVIQVTANYAYSGILGGTLPSLGLGSDSDLTINLQATVAMRAL